jgi:hypothetical protein
MLHYFHYIDDKDFYFEGIKYLIGEGGLDPSKNRYRLDTIKCYFSKKNEAYCDYLVLWIGNEETKVFLLTWKYPIKIRPNTAFSLTPFFMYKK